MSKLRLSFKGKTLKVYPVPEGELLIGSDPACTVHIDSLAVAAQHARLVTRQGTTVLHDLGSEAGTWVNQNRVAGEQPLQGDELIRIGKHTLTFLYEPPLPVEADSPGLLSDLPAATASGSTVATPRSAWLQILNGQNLGKTLSLQRAMTNLGKPGVARAVIARRPDGFFLSHLEGTTPPLVSEQPIGDTAHRLHDGDVIQIGNVRMQFYFE